MAGQRVNDLPGADDSQPTETGEKYALSELAKMMDAPVEKVRQWLTDGGIEPIRPDYPEDYGMDAVEYIRMKGHQF